MLAYVIALSNNVYRQNEQVIFKKTNQVAPLKNLGKNCAPAD